MRKKLIAFLTFLGGVYYVMEFITPKFLPTSVPTAYHFSAVCREHGGQSVSDEIVVFQIAGTAASACAEMDIDFDVPALLAGRPAKAEWMKEGKALGKIGARLSIDAATNDPPALDDWTLEPAFWHRQYTTPAGVQTMTDVCTELGGTRLKGDGNLQFAFERAETARAAARRLGVDIDWPDNVLARPARLIRSEQGAFRAELTRGGGDAPATFAAWTPVEGRWLQDVLVHPYFMFGGHHELISDVFIIIWVAAIFLGLINVLRSHGMRVVMRRKRWGYSVALLGGMIAMLVGGFVDWYRDAASAKAARFEIDALANAQVAAVEAWEKGGFDGARPAVIDQGSLEEAVPEAAADKAALEPGTLALHISHFYKDTIMGLGGLFIGLSSAMFSLLALYIASAAYRAFRIKSGEAALMMFTALLVMLGQIPMGTAMCNPLFESAGIPGGIVTVRAWIMEVINTAAFRGIYFGTSIAMLAMGVRMWLSMETGSFYKEDD